MRVRRDHLNTDRLKTGVFRQNRRKRNQALIIFTREPVPGQTKTRLMPYLLADECACLHRCFLRDLRGQIPGCQADVLIFYDGVRPAFLRHLFGKGVPAFRQEGEGLGARMQRALEKAFELGYEKAVLIGTDIPELKTDSITKAYDLLETHDVVLGPTEDGGYYLVGMKEMHPEAFEERSYGGGDVLEETIAAIGDAGLSAALTDLYQDMDEPDDLAAFRRRMRRDRRLRRSHTGRFLARTAAISVIIPVYNESARIEQMMKQLAPAGDKMQVIFVDGGSTDGTPEVIGDQFPVVRTEKGRGRQMNAGAESARGDILFFLHCDSILPENFADEIRRVMARHRWGCFGVIFPSRNFFQLTNRVISNFRAYIRRIPYGDQGIFIERELFFDSGMFPEIPVMEDVAFSMDMRKRGIRPGMTRRRIITSTRRYGGSTLGILRTQWSMIRLRRRYRKGEDAKILARAYRDIR